MTKFNLYDDQSLTDHISETDKTDGQIILEENSNFQPTENEVLEYAESVLNLQQHEIPDLLWLAEEGIKAPLPAGWKPVQTDDGQLYYFNFKNGESSWDHPCDEFYKKKLVTERQKLKDSKKKSNLKDSATKLNPLRSVF